MRAPATTESPRHQWPGSPQDVLRGLTTGNVLRSARGIGSPLSTLCPPLRLENAPEIPILNGRSKPAEVTDSAAAGVSRQTGVIPVRTSRDAGPTVRPRDRLLPEAEAEAVEVAAGAQAAEAVAGAAAASAGRAEAIPWGTVYQPPTEMPARFSCTTDPGVSSRFVAPSTLRAPSARPTECAPVGTDLAPEPGLAPSIRSAASACAAPSNGARRPTRAASRPSARYDGAAPGRPQTPRVPDSGVKAGDLPVGCSRRDPRRLLFGDPRRPVAPRPPPYSARGLRLVKPAPLATRVVQLSGE
jgi:hypothetical protein